MIDKPKSKKKSKSQLATEFVSPYTLEECIAILESTNNTNFPFAPTTTKFRVFVLDPDHYEYQVGRKNYKGFSARAKGKLMRWYDNTTFVTCEAQHGEDSGMAFFLIILGAILSLVTGGINWVYSLVIGGIFLILAWGISRAEPQKVLNYVNNLLDPEDKSDRLLSGYE
jgi:hypothetical protein